MAKRFSIETVFKAVDKVTAPVTRMQNKLGKLTRSVQKNMRRLDRTVSKITRGVATGLKAGFVGASAAAGGLFIALNKVTASADALAKQSRRLDIPIEQLQEWKFVSEQSGVSTELLDKSLGAFSKRLGEARSGIGPLVSGLKKSNPELLKQLMTTDDIGEAFELMVVAMREAETATEKAALANAAFSRSGLQMVDISKNSASQIAMLRQEQRENGVVSMQQAEAAEAYNDAMNSLKRALAGFMQSVLIPLTPMITDILRKTREWTVANREIMSEKVLNWFSSLRDRFGEIVTWIKRIGTVIAVLVAFNAVLKIIIATMTALNLIMAANPIVLMVIAAVAALAGMAYLVVKHWDPIKQFFIDLWDGITDAFNAAVEKITAVIDKLIALKDKVVGVAGAVGGNIKDFGGNVIDKTGGFFGNALDNATQFFGMDDEQGRPAPTPPQVQGSTSTTTIERGEVVIRDETGRAEGTNLPNNTSMMRLTNSGAF